MLHKKELLDHIFMTSDKEGGDLSKIQSFLDVVWGGKRKGGRALVSLQVLFTLSRNRVDVSHICALFKIEYLVYELYRKECFKNLKRLISNIFELIQNCKIVRFQIKISRVLSIKEATPISSSQICIISQSANMNGERGEYKLRHPKKGNDLKYKVQREEGGRLKISNDF